VIAANGLMMKRYLPLLFIFFAITSEATFGFGSSSTKGRVEKLERDLNILQKQFYKGSKPDLVSENDPLLDTSTVTDMDSRIADLEEEMRFLTGKVDEATHNTGELKKKLELLEKGLDERLKSLESNNMGTKQKIADNDVKEELEDKRTPKAQYDAAFDLVKKGDYDEAEEALMKFIEKNEKNVLVGNAYYWLGETHYARGIFEQSALNFLYGYKKFPKGNKAMHNLFKLAMSLARMEKNKEACKSFEQLKHEFPKLPAKIKKNAEQEILRMACKKKYIAK
jgi:tol-pal system protein YbgF